MPERASVGNVDQPAYASHEASCVAGTASNRGLRAENQDAVCVDADHGFAILADGMGGAAAGSHASGLALRFASELLLSCLREPSRQGSLLKLVEEVTREVNRRVHREAQSDRRYKGMGTTLVILLLRGGRAAVANVGDSRAYRIRQEALTQLTHDHSRVQERVDAGLLSPDEALREHDRNVLTQAIGVSADVEPHTYEAGTEPEDTYVLTSDGVHASLAGHQLLRVAGSSAPDVAALALVELALAEGSKDNATAAVVRVCENPVEDSDASLEAILNRPIVQDPPPLPLPPPWVWYGLIAALVALLGFTLWAFLTR